MICLPRRRLLRSRQCTFDPRRQPQSRPASNLEQLDDIGESRTQHLRLHELPAATITSAHIGILGVDKNNEEWYQVTLGVAPGQWTPRIGKVIGPSFAAADDVPGVVERLVEHYRAHRQTDERFIDTYRRIGMRRVSRRRAYDGVITVATESRKWLISSRTVKDRRLQD
jgi:hypothetical protein